MNNIDFSVDYLIQSVIQTTDQRLRKELHVSQNETKTSVVLAFCLYFLPSLSTVGLELYSLMG